MHEIPSISDTNYYFLTIQFFLVSRTLSCGMTSASTSQNPLTCCSSTGTAAPPPRLLGTRLMCRQGWILVIFQETAFPKSHRRSLTSHSRFVPGCVCTHMGVIYRQQFFVRCLLIPGWTSGFALINKSLILPLASSKFSDNLQNFEILRQRIYSLIMGTGSFVRALIFFFYCII